jgi:hypothetical protein
VKYLRIVAEMPRPFGIQHDAAMSPQGLNESTNLDIEPGSQFPLHFAWSPSTGMVRATYRVEVESYEPRGDRFQCQLLELVEASGVQVGSELTREMLDRLVGQHVLVPREGLNGLSLRLKMTTLTGGLKKPYFFNDKPHSADASGTA